MFRKNIAKLLQCALHKQIINNSNEYILRQVPKNWLLKTQYAGIRTTNRNLDKLFVENENDFAHGVLVQSIKPYQIFNLNETNTIKQFSDVPKLVLDPPATVQQTTIDELFEAYVSLAAYCIQTNTCISDERFIRFTQLYCDASHLLNDEQLLETLRLLAKMPNVHSVKALNFVDLWNNIDVECCRRIDKWKTKQLLLVSDAWYRLRMARICEFVREALRKLGRKVLKMPPEQLVQTMFLCNLIRRPIFDMFDFEVNLAKCADQLTLQELGVMSMGFFKTQTPIRNPELLALLYQRLGAELDTVEDITLVAILKILRYSTKLRQAELIFDLLDKMCPQINRISLISCLHAALLGSDLQCCHEGLLELVLQRFQGNIEQTRLKDLERICFVIGLMNYSSPSGIDQVLCRNILSILNKRVDEIMKHPRSFPLCLHFLTLKGFYNTEMISSVLDTNFINHAYGKNLALGREIFYLDSFVKINLENANYVGNQLTEKQRATMGKVLTNYIPERKYRLNVTDRILIEIKETVETIFKYNAFKHILPHFERPDVIVCYDKDKRDAVPLAIDCPEDYSGVILTRQELLGDNNMDNVVTIAIVVAGWNNVVRGKERLTGLFDMKLKQLQLLGHKHIVIYWHEWRELETQKDRQNFIKRKLASAIKA